MFLNYNNFLIVFHWCPVIFFWEWLNALIHVGSWMFYFPGAYFSPQRISVKKIILIVVKKSGLFERSEFPDFRQLIWFLGNYLQRRHFLLTFFCCSGAKRIMNTLKREHEWIKKVRARAAWALERRRFVFQTILLNLIFS